MAALSVFGVHYQQLTHVDPGSIGPFDLKTLLINGNTGVALFFVLSGVLLSLPYWRVGKDSGPLPSLGGYWLRRLARILPAYYLCLTVLVIQNGYWQKSSRINDVLSHYLLFFRELYTRVESLDSMAHTFVGAIKWTTIYRCRERQHSSQQSPKLSPGWIWNTRNRISGLPSKTILVDLFFRCIRIDRP